MADDSAVEEVEAVVSPMASYLSALSACDILRLILVLLPPPDLARSACVSRLWRDVAGDRAVAEEAFRKPWGVERVLGDPSSPAFWRSPVLSRFAVSHRIRRWDTVHSLALKYSVQVVDIKRLNNMISDHGIYTRERLLIPISNPELLLGSTCYVELDQHAKRQVATLYLEGGPSEKQGPAKSAGTTRQIRKILDSVKRSLKVDDATAAYYLSIANGNPRAAMVEFSEDLGWEQQMTSH